MADAFDANDPNNIADPNNPKDFGKALGQYLSSPETMMAMQDLASPTQLGSQVAAPTQFALKGAETQLTGPARPAPLTQVMPENQKPKYSDPNEWKGPVQSVPWREPADPNEWKGPVQSVPWNPDKPELESPAANSSRSEKEDASDSGSWMPHFGLTGLSNPEMPNLSQIMHSFKTGERPQEEKDDEGTSQELVKLVQGIKDLLEDIRDNQQEKGSPTPSIDKGGKAERADTSIEGIAGSVGKIIGMVGML